MMRAGAEGAAVVIEALQSPWKYARLQTKVSSSLMIISLVMGFIKSLNLILAFMEALKCVHIQCNRIKE